MCKKHFCRVIHRRIHVRFASQEAQQTGQVFSMIIFQYKMTSAALLLYRQQPQGITSVNCDATWRHIITIEPLHHSQKQLRKSSPLLNHILRLLSIIQQFNGHYFYIFAYVCVYIYMYIAWCWEGWNKHPGLGRYSKTEDVFLYSRGNNHLLIIT